MNNSRVFTSTSTSTFPYHPPIPLTPPVFLPFSRPPFRLLYLPTMNLHTFHPLTIHLNRINLFCIVNPLVSSPLPTPQYQPPLYPLQLTPPDSVLPTISVIPIPFSATSTSTSTSLLFYLSSSTSYNTTDTINPTPLLQRCYFWKELCSKF